MIFPEVLLLVTNLAIEDCDELLSSSEQEARKSDAAPNKIKFLINYFLTLVKSIYEI